MKSSSLVTMFVSIRPSVSSEVGPVRSPSARGMAITRGRMVAICGRYASVMIVHSSEPPKVGRVAARARVLGSMASSVQSAVRPVSRVVATEPARSRPWLVAPSSTISGLYLLTRSVRPLVLVAVALEHRIAHEVDVVRAEGEGLLGEAVEVFIGAAEQHAAQG